LPVADVLYRKSAAAAIPRMSKMGMTIVPWGLEITVIRAAKL
jgi:hypothetical protein